MKVCVIGTGYVGLVTGTCLAEMGNEVICVDNNAEKIRLLQEGAVPIYEPGLEELIRTNTQDGRLRFTTNLGMAVRQSLICIIAVGTPEGKAGSADLSAVFAVAQEIATYMDDYKVIVTKSTVPVGTAKQLKALIAQHTPHEFSVVSNPEFLKQGAAVDDFLKPDRVVIGTDNPRASDIMSELYSPFLRTGNPILIMDIPSAEMTKYVANAFLATKISFINEMSNLCEQVGADIDQVRNGIATDNRIGNQFLFPGLGYGGSCFPKDVKALIRTARDVNCHSTLLEAVDRINQEQRNTFIQKILAHYQGSVEGKIFGVWGLAFKPKTDDMRDAPSITIIEALQAAGAQVQAFDPKAIETAKRLFGSKVTYSKTRYEALDNADALLLLTEWPEFRRPDFETMKSRMRGRTIFDGRNQYDPQRMQERGFHYVCMGRNTESPQGKGMPATVLVNQ
ncbi:MAG: UDP-glucose/GDP-mannose dehydrogenase family protein [Candidatus Melainabacteria bacterium]|nr:UDP-glucose/GDP-mannose dehydrogenase family protein [Candidatus Melainabacteria bacterium]